MENEKKGPVFNRNFAKLTDDSAMPGRGIHAGKKMANLPAKYLLYISENGMCTKDVQAYITDNYEVLCHQAGQKPKGSGMVKTPVRAGNRHTPNPSKEGKRNV